MFSDSPDLRDQVPDLPDRVRRIAGPAGPGPASAGPVRRSAGRGPASAGPVQRKSGGSGGCVQKPPDYRQTASCDRLGYLILKLLLFLPHLDANTGM